MLNDVDLFCRSPGHQRVVTCCDTGPDDQPDDQPDDYELLWNSVAQELCLKFFKGIHVDAIHFCRPRLKAGTPVANATAVFRFEQDFMMSSLGSASIRSTIGAHIFIDPSAEKCAIGKHRNPFASRP